MEQVQLELVHKSQPLELLIKAHQDIMKVKFQI